MLAGALRRRAWSTVSRELIMGAGQPVRTLSAFTADRDALLRAQQSAAAAAAPLADVAPAPPGGAPVPCILDTDIGDDIDDTWALAMLLNSPELDLRYVITSGAGHHRARARLVARMLAAAGRAHVRIGLGVEEHPRCAMRQAAWAEAAGPGGPGGGGGGGGGRELSEAVELSEHPGGVDEDGVGGMLRAVRAIAAQAAEAAEAAAASAPAATAAAAAAAAVEGEDGSPAATGAGGLARLIVISPCQNLHAALQRDPAFAPLAHFIGMHGSVRSGYSGRPGAAAEFNVANDVAGARAVFAAPFASKTITPLDTCGIAQLAGARYARVVRAARDAPGARYDPRTGGFACSGRRAPAEPGAGRGVGADGADGADGALALAVLENVCVWEPLFVETRPHLAELYNHAAGSTSILFDCVAVALALPAEAQRLLHLQRLRLEVSDEGILVERAAGDSDGDGDGAEQGTQAQGTQAPGVLDVAVGWRDYGRFEEELVRRVTGAAVTLDSVD